jgi:hypothetical protein
MSKGGQQTQDQTSEQRMVQQSTRTLPRALTDMSNQNLALADQAGRIGFVPYMGPTVAGLSEPQQASMANTNAAASAFGLAQAPAPPTPQMPGGKGGTGMGAGFSPAELYMQAILAMPPGQRAAIEAMMMNPQTGAAPQNQFSAPTARRR